MRTSALFLNVGLVSFVLICRTLYQRRNSSDRNVDSVSVQFSTIAHHHLALRDTQDSQRLRDEYCVEHGIYKRLSCPRLSCMGEISSVYFRVLNKSCSDSRNGQEDKLKCYDRMPVQFPLYLRIYSKAKRKSSKQSEDEVLYEGLLRNQNEVISVYPNTSKLYAELYDASSGQALQSSSFYVDCSKPLSLKDSFGALQVVEVSDSGQHVSCCILPSPVPSVLPSFSPTSIPTNVPSHEPSELPSNVPSYAPSSRPTLNPSGAPSMFPTCPKTTCMQSPDHIIFEVKPYVSCEGATSNGRSIALLDCTDVVVPIFPLKLVVTPYAKTSKSKKNDKYLTPLVFHVTGVGQTFVLDSTKIKKIPKSLQFQFMEYTDSKNPELYQTVLIDTSCYSNRAFSIGDSFGVIQIIGFSNYDQGQVGCL